MKSVLISIRPQWVEKITRGEKTIEVRKTAPKGVPFKAYIYCTSSNVHDCILIDKSGLVITYATNHKTAIVDSGYCGNGKVIGEFVCDKVDEYNFHEGLTEFNSMGLPSRIYGSYLIFADDYKAMCLSYDEVKNYGKGKTLYGWHISDLKIYDKPKELSEFFVHKKVKGGCENCAYYRTPTLEFCQDCKSGKQPKKYLTRPPQSWQYVEELENGQKTAD